VAAIGLVVVFFAVGNALDGGELLERYRAG
jgi:hypothetical protein